ncbi:MAG: hypothetical protein IKJ19_02525 [Clostridia bacterium]|nr:hypothetical protein [Clostridia bacterium]
MNINGYVPQRKLNNKAIITLQNISNEDICEILYYARDIKRKQAVGEKINCLSGQHVALLTKPAYVRSRVAFQIAVDELGGNPITVSLPGLSIEQELKDPDTTTVMKSFGLSAVVVDTEFLRDAEVLENYSTMPVINANGRNSPCQTLATLLTIWEQKGKLQGLHLAVIGALNNGDYSLIAGAAKCGLDISVICPDGSEPPEDILSYCNQFGYVDVYDNIEDGIRGADVIFIMDHDFDKSFLFTDRYFKYANKDAILLHSMPIRRGVDISEEAINNPHTLIFDQAMNVLPVLKAVLALTVGKFHD